MFLSLSRIAKAPILALLSAIGMAAACPAQLHTPQFYAIGPYLHSLDGQTRSVRQITSGLVTGQGLTMDLDNRRVIFSANNPGNGFPAGIYRYDPSSQTVETLFRDTNLLARPGDVEFDGDGNLHVSTGTFGMDALLRLSQDFKTYTVVAVPSPLRPGNWSGGMRMDISSGQMVLEDQNAPEPLLAIDRTGVIRTLATGFDSRGSITQDLLTGDWYCSGYKTVHRLATGLNSPTPFVSTSLSGVSFDALAMDRASAKSRIMHVTNYYGMMTIDVDTRTVTGNAMGGGLSYKTEMIIANSRNLASRRTAPLQYRFDLSFAGHAGRRYVVALTAQGAAFPLRLPDGRALAIIPDALTYLSVGGPLPPLFAGNTGVLDPVGRGAMTIDVTSIPGIAGTRIWAQPVVLDPAAPLGIAVIGNPIGISLN